MPREAPTQQQYWHDAQPQNARPTHHYPTQMNSCTALERWDFPESNAEQRYATHGFFRYYGKLPPVVTKRILAETAPYLSKGPGVDVACGSGTTLVEAALLGLPFEGLD